MEKHINESTIKGKWKEIKGEIRKKWGQLTDNDLEKTKGDLTAIGGMIQQKYGHAKDEIKTKLEDLVNRFSDKRRTETQYHRDPTTQGADAEMQMREDEGDIMNKKERPTDTRSPDESKDYH